MTHPLSSMQFHEATASSTDMSKEPVRGEQPVEDKVTMAAARRNPQTGAHEPVASVTYHRTRTREYLPSEPERNGQMALFRDHEGPATIVGLWSAHQPQSGAAIASMMGMVRQRARGDVMPDGQLSDYSHPIVDRAIKRGILKPNPETHPDLILHGEELLEHSREMTGFNWERTTSNDHDWLESGTLSKRQIPATEVESGMRHYTSVTRRALRRGRR